MKNGTIETEGINYDTFPILYDSIGDENGTGENGDAVGPDEAINSIGFGKYQVCLFIFAGIAWMSDGMEIMVLSIILGTLKIEWNLTTFQVSSMVSVVFMGTFLGSLVFGFLSDKFGRKKCLIFSSLLLTVASIASALSTNYISFIIFRFFVGLGFAGNIQIDTYFTEIMPTKYRGHSIFGIMFFWTVGGVLAVLMARVVGIENGGWHRWLLWLSIPTGIFFIATLFIPESFRYLLDKGNHNIALENLKKMAKMNNSELVHSRIIVESTSVDFSYLKVAENIKRILSVCYIWFVDGLVYFGVVLYSVALIDDNFASSSEVSPGLSNYQFYFYLISTAIEFPSYGIGLFSIEFFGRKKSIALFTSAMSVCVLLLLLPIKVVAAITFLSIARLFGCALNTTIFLYTNELFPTNMRSFTLGLGNSFLRIGAIITPYVTEYLYENSSLALNLVYFVFSSIATILVLCTLVETKGKPLN